MCPPGVLAVSHFSSIEYIICLSRVKLEIIFLISFFSLLTILYKYKSFLQMLNAHKVAQKKYRDGNAEYRDGNAEYRARDNDRRKKNMTEEEKEKERQHDCERKRRKVE